MRGVLTLVLSIQVLVGCGASGGGEDLCSNGKCGGCCLDSVCHPGTEASACGTGGTCVVCPSGTPCVGGTCGGSPCDASSCPSGCCTATGVCLEVGQQSATACGLGGYTCQSCGSDQCVNGVCQGAPSCGPGTCQGCCASGQCIEIGKQSAASCGNGGTPCKTCPEGSCGEGQCQGVSCDASTCAQGCCSPEGCLLYAQQDSNACGTGGAPCQPCAPGTCNGNGQCESTPSCDPGTCANGCCSDPTTCLPFASQNPGSCGGGGNPCAPCDPGASCTNGQCVNLWKVRVISAVVLDKPGSWDPSGISGPLPDPFVVVQVTSNGKTGQTKYIDDTLTPLFNQEVLTETEPALAAGVTCFVKEDDGFGLLAEGMGKCVLGGLTPGQLQAGQITVAPCDNYVTQVVLGFSK